MNETWEWSIGGIQLQDCLNYECYSSQNKGYEFHILPKALTLFYLAVMITSSPHTSSPQSLSSNSIKKIDLPDIILPCLICQNVMAKVFHFHTAHNSNSSSSSSGRRRRSKKQQC
jgi:hypothetical protein